MFDLDLTLDEEYSLRFIYKLWEYTKQCPNSFKFVRELIDDHCDDFPHHMSTYWMQAMNERWKDLIP